jgi:hypothetical protein
MKKQFDPTPVTTLRDGQEFCYECDGSRRCLFCEGAGYFESGRRCSSCCGDGTCLVCAGNGVLGLGADAATGNPTVRDKLSMTLVGNFSELGFTEDVCQTTLASARQHRSAEHKTEVLHFLRAGKPLMAAPSHTRDAFTGAAIADKPTIVTNGVYAWPLALAYYVEHHNIVLPEAFEAHMARHGWQVPEELDVNRLAIYPKFKAPQATDAE